jgi:hypothetical protein
MIEKGLKNDEALKPVVNVAQLPGIENILSLCLIYIGDTVFQWW